MLHFMYVGHFAHQGDFIRFDKRPDGSLHPAIQRPLSLDAVRAVLMKRGLSPSSVPEDWGVWLENGYVVCDAITRSRDAIEFIRDLALETGCDLADYSSQALVSPTEFACQRPLLAEIPQTQSKVVVKAKPMAANRRTNG
jgi:hypothetical protein